MMSLEFFIAIILPAALSLKKFTKIFLESDVFMTLYPLNLTGFEAMKKMHT